MKKLRMENWKSVALVVLFVGLVAIGSGNASPLADDGNQVCTNATLHGTYQWSVAGFIQTTTLNGGNIGDFAPIVEASYAVFDGHGTITKLVSADNFSSGGSLYGDGDWHV